MAGSRKDEANIPFTVSVDDVKSAVCRDPNQCTVAKALAPVLADMHGDIAAETVSVKLDFGNDLSDDTKVVVGYDGYDRNGDIRHYTAEVPGNVAFNIVTQTDTRKPTLIREIKRNHNDGIELELENVTSRRKQSAIRPPADTTTLKYAYDLGYRHGRSVNAAQLHSKTVESDLYQSFTIDQRTEYTAAFRVGLAKGPYPRRTPRRSGNNTGRAGFFPVSE